MMRQQGENPSELPRNLYFTFCGDLLSSGGEHYEKGYKMSLGEAIRIANRHYSDDFSESLAMWQLKDRKWKCDLASLMAQREKFLDVIRQHYKAYGQQYSPWSEAIFEEQDLKEYAALLAGHTSCGVAMRATALAPTSLTLEQILPFFLITHANTQAVSGGYYILGMARAFIKGLEFEDAMLSAEEAEKKGRELALVFLEKNALPNPKDIKPSASVHEVLESSDPYSVIKTIEKEGIETHFVVACAMLVLNEIERKNPENGAVYIILRALEIGGDPDTIASIAMGLYGLWQTDRCEGELAQISL